MSLTDTKGVPWAHSDTCKAGDRLKCDGGFTCIAKGTVLTVQSNPTEANNDSFMGLFIPCDDGKHYLDGQLGDDGELVGLYNA